MARVIKDPVTVEIFVNFFRAAAEHMAHSLLRTAYTTFIKENNDFATGLVTPQGEIFAYPLRMGVASFVGLNLEAALACVPNYRDGDIIVTNDPESTRGAVTHLPDFHLWKPVFHQGKLICFAWAFIHVTDIGGIVPCSISRAASELFQEGTRIPPQRLYREGVLNSDLADIIKANSRIPNQIWGDLQATVAALNSGERRMHDAIAKFGLKATEQGMQDVLFYAEERVRHAIAEIPDGQYFFADYIEDDAFSDVPVRIAVTLTVKGSDIHLDFTGTDPQVQGPYNLPTFGKRHPFPVVALLDYFMTADSSVPINGGIMRPVTMYLPQGSLLNPDFPPAAVGIRYATVHRLFDVVCGVLAQALPERIPAAGASIGIMVVASVFDPLTGRNNVSVIQPVHGGAGGSRDHDGIDGTEPSAGHLRNTPTEILESEIPVVIRRYGLDPDSAGAGRRRGGMGIRLDFQTFTPGTVVTLRGIDRFKFRPWGFLGGRAGAKGRLLLNPDSPQERDQGKADVLRIGPGDIVSVRSPAGGGYGSPLRRAPELVAEDVRSGLVSRDAAGELYGVVIADGHLDLVATERLRKDLGGRGRDVQFDFGPERESHESAWSRSMYDALNRLLAELPQGLRPYASKVIHQEMDALARQRPVAPDDVPVVWERAPWHRYQVGNTS